MARRFPRGVVVTFRRNGASDAGPEGHTFEARGADGAYLAGGWSEGGKSEARDAAWRVLEEIGLVTDGVSP